MPVPALIRLLSILVLLTLRGLVPEAGYHAFFIAMVLGHNIVTLIYSRRRVINFFSAPAQLWKIALLAVIGILSFQYYQTTFLYLFGIHHALSETYTASPRSPSSAEGFQLALIRGLLNLFIFIHVGNYLPDFAALPYSLVSSLTILMAFTFFAFVILRRKTFEKPVLTGIVLFEAVGLAAALAINPAFIRIEDLVLYHIIFWFFYPLYDQWKGWNGFNFRAICLSPLTVSVGVIGVLCLMTMDPRFNPGLSGSQWDMLGYYTAYLHIWSSLVLSRLNPAWIRRFFRAAAPAPTPPYGVGHLEYGERSPGHPR